MLRILFLFLIIVAAIILGPSLVGYQGKIVVEMAGYSIKTSVTAFGIMLLIALAIITAFILLLRRLFKFSSTTKRWFFDSKQVRAEKMTHAAMYKLIEGDYERAEKLLVSSAKDAPQPTVNYLLAAESAQRRNDLISTNMYLEQATETAGKNQVPVDITRIRIQLAHNAFDAARQGVDALLKEHPRHPEILQLAQKAYQQSGAFDALLELIPVLEKTNLIDSDEAKKLQLAANVGLMDKILAKEGVDGLKQWWANQPRKVRSNNQLKVIIANKFIACQDYTLAEDIIIEGLKQEYDEDLIHLIPKLNSTNVEKLEQMLWKLIKKQGATPLLNSTLAQLLIQHGDWASAKERLQIALEQHPNPQDYALLADTYEHLSQEEEANKVRREALSLTLNQS